MNKQRFAEVLFFFTFFLGQNFIYLRLVSGNKMSYKCDST
ncbi:hypothetical protein SAMN05443246_0413 [Paenibacillus sp. GP183]|nr:hypothetical protein SAMN05443246_0413 [Paenibacillus sp. GP183]